MAAAKVEASDTRTTGPARSKYRPEIDGLRAFAVAAVIINHFNKDLLPSGYLGVDIFFVISGYVITSSLASRKSKDFRHFVATFYERRIKRLVPALVVFVVITSLLISLFNPDPELALRTGSSALFGFSNIYLFQQAVDYFAQSTELNPFTQTWSLGVEEQFYMLFPFLIWFSGFGQQKSTGARNLMLWVGALAVASLISFIYLNQVNQPAGYFLMPSRFWEMAAGCLFFLGYQKRASLELMLSKFPPMLIIAIITGIMFRTIAGNGGTIAVVLLTGVLIASLKEGSAAYKVFTSQEVLYIGLISYSLYLWHWGVLAIGRWTIGVNWWSTPILLAITFLAASGSYHFVERPFRSTISPAVSTRRIYLTALTIVLTAASGITAATKIKILGLTPTILLYLTANQDAAVMLTEDAKTGKPVIKVAAAPAWGNPANPADARRLARCHFGRPITDEDFKVCVGDLANDTSKGQRIFILGDSHAANYAFAFNQAFPGKVGLITAGWGCGYLSPADAKKIDSAKMNCTDYVRKVESFVKSLSPKDVVVLGLDWRTGSVKHASPFQEQAIRKLAGLAAQRGSYFVLLDDVPDLGEPEISMVKWYRPFGKTAAPAWEIDNKLQSLDAIGKRLTRDFVTARYLPLRKGLCEEKECSFTHDGKPIYFNHGHITVEASQRLSAHVERGLSDIIKN